MVAAGRGLVHPDGRRRPQPRQQDRGLHLRAGDRAFMLDPAEPCAVQHQRQRIAPFDTRAHAAERRDDPPHRAPRQAHVPDELRAQSLEARRSAHQQPCRGAAVAAIDRGRRRGPFGTRDEQRVAILLDPRAECLDGRASRRNVLGMQKSGDARRPFRERGEDQRAVADRLVAGDPQRASEPRRGMRDQPAHQHPAIASTSAIACPPLRRGSQAVR